MWVSNLKYGLQASLFHRLTTSGYTGSPSVFSKGHSCHDSELSWLGAATRKSEGAALQPEVLAEFL